MWEALVGQRLFGELDRVAVYRRVTAADVPSLAAARPDIPRPLADVVHRALAADPAARFPSAREMAKALGDVLRRSSVREDSYELLAATVKQARHDLAMGHRTQGPVEVTSIPELNWSG